MASLRDLVAQFDRQFEARLGRRLVGEIERRLADDCASVRRRRAPRRAGGARASARATEISKLGGQTVGADERERRLGVGGNLDRAAGRLQAAREVATPARGRAHRRSTASRRRDWRRENCAIGRQRRRMRDGDRGPAPARRASASIASTSSAAIGSAPWEIGAKATGRSGASRGARVFARERDPLLPGRRRRKAVVDDDQQRPFRARRADQRAPDRPRHRQDDQRGDQRAAAAAAARACETPWSPSD